VTSFEKICKFLLLLKERAPYRSSEWFKMNSILFGSEKSMQQQQQQQQHTRLKHLLLLGEEAKLPVANLFRNEHALRRTHTHTLTLKHTHTFSLSFC